jgi:hypothetical protein
VAVRRLVEDHHRLLLGPAAAAGWDRRLAELPTADEATVVLVGDLCRVDDLDAELARLREGLAAGGRVLFVEHVGRPGPLGRLQTAWGDATAGFPWGCHTGRDVPAAFRRAGFRVSDLERFTMPTLVPALRSWVSGVAHPAPPATR